MPLACDAVFQCAVYVVRIDGCTVYAKPPPVPVVTVASCCTVAEPYGWPVIAKGAGWHCVTCNRGPFHVIEVWVENDTMVEVLPPEFAAEYLAFTDKDKVLTAMASAPNPSARHRH